MFRSPDNNVLLLAGLFFEEDRKKTWNPPHSKNATYTLKFDDYTDTTGKTYKSLYRLYMEEEDITEYLFASKYLESYDHWKKLCETNWFKPHVEKWREHLNLFLKAKALTNITYLANDPECKDHLSANKYLLDKGYKDGDKDKEHRRKSKASKIVESTNTGNVKIDPDEHYELLFNLTKDEVDQERPN